MYHMNRTVAVNDDPQQPRLSRGDVWRGLCSKPTTPCRRAADDPLRGARARDTGSCATSLSAARRRAKRVSFLPEAASQFERVQGRRARTIQNEILETSAASCSCVCFRARTEGVTPGSPAEQEHFEPTESAYLNAVNATLEAIRRVVREQGGTAAGLHIGQAG